MKTAQKVHFRVDPEGLTRLVREMWAEGSFEKCLNVLASVKCGDPIPLEIQYDIIRGKKKFALYRKDPDSFCIRADKWKPRSFSHYPDPAPEKLTEFLAKKAQEETDREMSRALRGYPPPDDEEDTKPAGRTFPEMKMFAGYASLEEMNLAFAFKRATPTPEQMIETMRSRDERAEKGRPVPDMTLEADAAWVSPDGNFYVCLTPMEHIWLVGQFGLSETQAEFNGWIKITRDFTGARFVHAGKTEPTQAQLNTVFDWCEKHNFPLPEWAGGKPEVKKRS